MKDINFFSIYSDKNSAGYKRKQLIKLGLLVLAVIMVLYAGLTVWLMTMEAEAQEINEYLMSPAVQESIAEYDRENNRLVALQQYNDSAVNLVDNMKNVNNLSVKILNTISANMPVTTRFEKISYNDGAFFFEIRTPSLAVGSQCVVRLKETELFSHVHLTSIATEEEGGYLCRINAFLKVGEAI